MSERARRRRGGLLDRAEDPAGVETDRIGAKDRRPPRLSGGRHRVGGEAEAMIVRPARDPAVVVVAPGDLAQTLADPHDDVDALLRPARKARDARAAGRPAVPTHRVR